MKLGFVFPGQGSQAVGMLADLAASYAEVEATFAEASGALGFDLWKLVREGPESALNETERTQPAMLAAGVAVWRVWRRLGGGRPEVVAGHSLGEYTALVCAGALGFLDATRLVAERARLMQAAVPEGEGAMAAILGLSDEQVVEVCERAAEGETVSAANFNAPGQVVIAGHANAVQRAVRLAKAAGARRAVELAVGVPSHCALMRPAAEGLRPRLEEAAFAMPEIPVLHNVDGAPRRDVCGVREALTAQLYSPVRWADTIRRMRGEGVRGVVECGPGRVLSGLNRRIEREIQALAAFDRASVEQALELAGAET